MPDYIGNIPVPEITPSGVFPLVPDYPHGRAHRPEVVVHQFGSGNSKIEQRFCIRQTNHTLIVDARLG